MTIQIFESPVPASVDELFAWHGRPGAFERLCPPWQSIDLREPAPLEDGSSVRLRIRRGPLRFLWTAEHREIVPGRGFTDVQTSGPFLRWIHRHEFEPTADAALLRDRIDYELRGGRLGQALAGRQTRRDIDATFAFRHERTARDLQWHRSFADQARLRIAVTGSSGLVGGNLVPFLTTGGHQVVRLVRGSAEATEADACWGPEAGLVSPRDVGPLDAVVHLAGENVAGGRWTADRKQLIRASRVDGTRNLVRSLGRMETPPRVFVCASAIGYYGSRPDETLDEHSSSGEGFLAAVCREWEEAALEATAMGMRVVMLRFGMILTPAGGALAKMLLPFRIGAGGRIGDGRQDISWVSIDDAIGAAYQALFDARLSGPVNVVAPDPTTNADLTMALGRVLRRPTPFRAPKAATRVLFGDMADEMLLASARVRPQRLESIGFPFGDTDLDRTLARLLGKVETS